jgi:hypothetical protein
LSVIRNTSAGPFQKFLRCGIVLLTALLKLLNFPVIQDAFKYQKTAVNYLHRDDPVRVLWRSFTWGLVVFRMPNKPTMERGQLQVLHAKYFLKFARVYSAAALIDNFVARYATHHPRTGTQQEFQGYPGR